MDIETEPNELTGPLEGDDHAEAGTELALGGTAEGELVDSGSVGRVRRLVTPILDDLGLDIYDLEHRGGVLRLTLDTPVDVEGGLTLDKLALASRLVSKELDAEDPIVSRYTLEVTSPGVERPLRRADHFRRALGQAVAIRLSDVESADRRVNGTLVAADDATITVSTPDGERILGYGQIDRARTVFEWGGQPKGAKPPKRKQGPARPGNAIEGDEL